MYHRYIDYYVSSSQKITNTFLQYMTHLLIFEYLRQDTDLATQYFVQ